MGCGMEIKMRICALFVLVITVNAVYSETDNDSESENDSIDPPNTNHLPNFDRSSTNDHPPDWEDEFFMDDNPDKNKRVVCYYTSWSQDRPTNGKFEPEDIDARLCTHILFAFAIPDKNSIMHDAAIEALYSRVMALKTINPKLKVLLSLGGGNVHSGPFTLIVGSADNRKDFINNAIIYLRQHHFDGLDVDWEFPGQFGSPPADQQNFLTFMKELRKGFQIEAGQSQLPRLLLTGAFPSTKFAIDLGYDIQGLSNVMDFINIMTYDFHGTWSDTVGFNSPLYARSTETGADAQLNVDWAARYYVTLNAPHHKLNLGIPTYGRTFNLSNPANVGAPFQGGGTAGPYTNDTGILAYYEICDLIKNGDIPKFDTTQRVPYIVSGNDWIGYDNKQSVKEKTCYMMDNDFGGVMFWDLSMDDFSGQFCGQSRFPLIKEALHVIANPRSC